MEGGVRRDGRKVRRRNPNRATCELSQSHGESQPDMTITEGVKKPSILAQCDLFTRLDGKVQASLAEFAQFRSVLAGDVVFRASDPGESMMIVARGSVRISAIAPTARDVILSEIEVGGTSGEIALLDGHGRSADARALKNCTLLVLERRDLLAVMEAEPRLAVTPLELFCARVRRSDERMMEFAFIQLPLRLARTLLSLSAVSDRAAARPLKRLS